MIQNLGRVVRIKILKSYCMYCTGEAGNNPSLFHCLVRMNQGFTGTSCGEEHVRKCLSAAFFNDRLQRRSQ